MTSVFISSCHLFGRSDFFFLPVVGFEQRLLEDERDDDSDVSEFASPGKKTRSDRPRLGAGQRGSFRGKEKLKGKEKSKGKERAHTRDEAFLSGARSTRVTFDDHIPEDHDIELNFSSGSDHNSDEDEDDNDADMDIDGEPEDDDDRALGIRKESGRSNIFE
jgi:hypothetical protein